MIELFKSVPLGGILSYVVALVVGSQGTSGGHLHITRTEVYQYDMWWSWPLFLAGTAVAWGIMAMQR